MDKATIARTAALIFALVNQVLTIVGKNPLPFSTDEVYAGISALLTVSVSLWTWWKNNNVTKTAQRNEKYLVENGMK